MSDLSTRMCERLIRRHSPLIAAALYWLTGQLLSAALVGLVWAWIAVVFGRLSEWVLLGGGIGWVISAAAFLASATVLHETARWTQPPSPADIR